jgi:ComF family protein
VTLPRPANVQPPSDPPGGQSDAVSLAAGGRWRLPSQCELCRAWCGGTVCNDCRQRFAAPRWRCACCALPLPEAQARCGECLADPPPFDAAVCAVDYAFPWDRLIQAFKFHDRTDLAGLLGGLLADAVRRQPASPPSLLMGVPLSSPRLVQRGYDQVRLLVRALRRSLDLPEDSVRHDLLERMLDAPPQAGLDRAARQHNLRGAFRVPDPARPVLQGRHVALVDDVMTTGATLREAAATLREAGAASVRLWVVARTA